jgi:hypothetical protein
VALIHASASRGSSALAKVDGFIAKKCSYMVTKFKPSVLGSCGGGFAVVVQQFAAVFGGCDEAPPFRPQ